MTTRESIRQEAQTNMLKSARRDDNLSDEGHERYVSFIIEYSFFCSMKTLIDFYDLYSHQMHHLYTVIHSKREQNMKESKENIINFFFYMTVAGKD
jgi:hypothetical protein